MNKLVNIYPTKPILNVNPPIRSRITEITLDTDTIRKCIISNAIVEEILNDGSTVVLTFENLNKNNDLKVEEKAPVEQPKQEPKKVEPKHEHVNVEPTKVEEVKAPEAEEVKEAVKDTEEQAKEYKKYNSKNNNKNQRNEVPKPATEGKPVENK